MSKFTDQLELDLGAVFLNSDEFATTIQYKGLEVEALVNYGSGDEYKGYDDFDVKAVVYVRVSQVSTVQTGDQLTIGTSTWEVIGAKLSGCGRLWEIEVNRRTS